MTTILSAAALHAAAGYTIIAVIFSLTLWIFFQLGRYVQLRISNAEHAFKLKQLETERRLTKRLRARIHELLGQDAYCVSEHRERGVREREQRDACFEQEWVLPWKADDVGEC